VAGRQRALAPQAHERLAQLVRGPGWRRIAVARRIAAALLGSCALVLALAPGADTGGVPVVVAAHDLSAGAPVQAADLVVRRWPSELLPDGALAEVAAAEGRVLVGAARAGEPLTDARLVGAELATRMYGSPDAAAVPVRLADAGVAALLAPGSRVDVVTVGPRPEQPLVLAADAAVLAVLPPGDDIGARGRLVLVAMPRTLASRVAAAALSEQLAITLR
jgi:pilus assembly protein CpaB